MSRAGSAGGRRVLWVASGLVAVLAAAAPVGYYLWAKAQGEHFYRGRSTSYWSQQTRRWLDNQASWSQPLLDRMWDSVSPPSYPSRGPAVFSSEPAAFPVLADFLRDADPGVRYYTIAYLAAFLDFDDILDGVGRRRMLATSTLESVGPETVTMVAAGLDDPHPLIREVVASLLGHLGPNARDAVVRALEDKDERVRATAEKALKRIERHAPD